MDIIFLRFVEFVHSILLWMRSYRYEYLGFFVHYYSIQFVVVVVVVVVAVVVDPTYL